MPLAHEAAHGFGGGEAPGGAAERHSGGPRGGVHHPHQDAQSRLQTADGRPPAADEVPEGAPRDLEGRIPRRPEARRREPPERQKLRRGVPEESSTSRGGGGRGMGKNAPE